jgi:hypothetical protein
MVLTPLFAFIPLDGADSAFCLRRDADDFFLGSQLIEMSTTAECAAICR